MLRGNSASHLARQALELLRAELGERYMQPDYFGDYLAGGKAANKVAFVALDPSGHTVLGVVLADLLAPESVPSAFLGHFEEVANLPEVYRLRNQTSGLIRSVAVDRHARNNGIATDLIQEAMRQLEQQGARVYFAFGWVFGSGEHAGECPIDGVFRSLDFSSVADLPNFWRDDSVEHNYECPVCGQPCICTARLFITG
jgi:GNAT superfamily N-acetyltransferase